MTVAYKSELLKLYVELNPYLWGPTDTWFKV